MKREFLTLPTIRRATPLRRNVQCVAFVATAALVTAMMAQGIRVRLNILDRWHYVAPLQDIGPERLHELLQDNRFRYIAIVTFLVASPGSLLTWNVPLDWTSTNKVECIAGGASGGVINSNFAANATGGSGAAYSSVTNISSLSAGGTALYEIGSGGAAVSVTGGNNPISGNNGGDTWFNGNTLAGSSVGAKGGVAGNAGNGGTVTGSAGGSSSGGVGSVKNSGGASGNSITNNNSTGGGGAAGPNGNGVASANDNSNGGNGDNGSGGAGGAFGTNGTNGGNGTEYDASHGSGGGGGASSTIFASGGPFSAGSGGSYGAGGGGCGIASTGPLTCTSGAGVQGLIVVTYTPAVPAGWAVVLG